LSSSTPADAVELIDAFFTHACARDPDGRFADARAMQRALESLQAFA
jgi:hypothetical protein